MAPTPSDFTLIGTVLAVSIAIILLSGLALYVAFRLRETLRDEKGGGARAAKVAFLIGLLFLSGGVFYFFASGLNAQSGGSSTLTVTTGSGSSTSTSTSTSSSSTSSATTSTTSTVSTTASVPGSSLSMSVSYPSSVGAGSGFYIQFTIYNNGASPVSGGTIDVGNLIYTFTIANATECNPQCSAITWSGSVINVGAANPGATVVSVGVKAPAQPTQYSGTASLYYQGVTQPTTVTIAIRVSGRP